MNLLEPLVERVRALSQRVDQLPTTAWGTVTATSPLTVRLDGDTTPLSPLSLVANLSQGDRVQVMLQQRRAIVYGRAGGDIPPPQPEKPFIFGHMGRTGGFQTIGKNWTEVQMDTAQILSGGVTKNGNSLVAPVAGLYRITGRGYTSGGGGGDDGIAGVFINGSLRFHAGTGKTTGNDVTAMVQAVERLNAGDKVSLWQLYQSAYGTNGYNGSYLELERLAD